MYFLNLLPNTSNGFSSIYHSLSVGEAVKSKSVQFLITMHVLTNLCFL